MSFVIRPARAEDVPSIATWTQDTFAWGDYVAEALPEWIQDQESLVVVCVDTDDTPLAISRVQLLSPTESWLSAARVHPDHRRSGMGSAMNDFAVEWSRDKGARVARLAAEEDNDAARSQVLKLGYRLTGQWLNAEARSTGRSRLTAAQRMRPGTVVDADAAWTFWSQSDLAQAARDLISLGWRWRKASRDDLGEAVDAGTFYQSPGGWAIAEREEESHLLVRWVATSPPDAPLLIQGLGDMIEEDRAETVEVMIPATPWSAEALVREGFDLHPIQIFSKAL